MADNTTLPGSGEVVEDKDIGAGVKRQVVTISPRDLSAVDSIGALTETAPTTDTASSGLNGRLQRIAQRVTALIALQPAALGAGGGFKVDGSGTSLPVTASAGTNLNTSALALDTTLGTTNTEIGGLTETAPATDTASSGVNGRLQRLAQRLTALMALMPASLGAKTASASLAVTTATDDELVTRMGNVTASPTANTLLARLKDLLSLVVLAGGENVIGKVGTNSGYIDVTFSLDTLVYASGDLLADTQVVTNAMRVTDGTGILQSMTLVDEDDQGVAMDIYFLSANNTMGTENSAPSISDANARDILGFISVATTDWKDLGGVRIATIKGIGLVVKPVSGTRNLYVAAVNGTGTPTFTASGVRARLGFLQD